MSQDLGKLLLRAAFGFYMLFLHGIEKIQDFEKGASRFGEFMGLSPNIAWALAILAEVGCSLLLILGLCTRYVAIPLIVVMLVAIFKVHGLQSLGGIEKNVIFITVYLSIILLGPGRYSLDHFLSSSKSSKRNRHK